MATTAKDLSPLVVPSAIRRKAGFKGGDELEFKVAAGAITISRKPPGAGDEYTPAQRRNIDARLTQALKGTYHEPFETAEETIRFLRKEIRNRKAQTSRFSKSALKADG
jgi:bifunctional DNA-binding transcriptional regulator/antitoxin component of YhaV-PrlF toxin-antitoxin module